MRLCYVGSLGSVHTERWIRYFAGQGHEVHVLTPVPASHHAPSTVHIHLVKQIRTGRRQIDLPINALLGIPQIMWYRAMLRRINPDLVHAHYLNDAAFFASLAGVRPFVSTAWGSDVLINPEGSRALRWMVRFILKRSDLITCDARHLREALIRLGADPARVRIVYFGTDTDTFTPDRRDPLVRERLGLRDGPVVISLRRLDPLYDVGTLIAAIPAVRERFPAVRVVVAGSGPEHGRLQAMAESRGVAPSVRFIGQVAEGDLPAYLTASDVYVSTALSDGGLAGSTAEAMACALPVVITDVADNREWVEDGVSGFLVPPSDPQALASKIIYLLEHPEERARLGQHGRRVIEQRNSWAVQMAGMQQVYEALVREAHERA